MSRGNRVLMACLACGLIFIAVGLIIGTPTVTVEGAYFDRANGVPAYAGVFSASRPALLDPADGNLWLGAGVALVLAGMGGFVWRRLKRQSQSALSD